KCDVDIRK
nr:RecName: Full=Actin [Carcinus maenas]